MPAPRLARGTKTTTGTLREHREPQSIGVDRLASAPPPPAGLSTRATEEWRHLAGILTELGTLAGSDLRALALLCETLATEAEARHVVATSGFTTGTADGGQKPHPAVRTMETARSQAAALLRDFGLTPRSRGGVDRLPRTEDDPADRYFKG
jgi:P27 family predicted phage terminase small subunit